MGIGITQYLHVLICNIYCFTAPYSAVNLPAGATLDPRTGLLSWTPNLFQAGDYTGIVLSASDGNRSSSETIGLQVANLNQAPVLVPLFEQSGRENNEISFTLTAADADADAIAFAAVNPLPAGARFDGRTGIFTWTPGYDQAGDYTLSFIAQDPLGARDTLDVVLHVANLDRSPVLVAEKHLVLLGTPFSLALKGSDPDQGTTLTYSVKGLPEGAVLDAATGVLSWTPGSGQAGDYLVMATVSDGEFSTTQPLVLRATSEPELPTVVIEQTPSFAAVPGQPVVVHVLASSFSPVTELSAYSDEIGHRFRRDSATDSGGSGHPFLSDAGLIVLTPQSSLSQAGMLFPHRTSLHCYFVRIMDQPVKYGICNGGISNVLMPVLDW